LKKQKIDPALFQSLFAQSTGDKKRENLLEQWADPNSSRSRKREEILSWWQLCAYEANSASGWKATEGYGRKYIRLAFAANKAKGFAGPRENIKKAQATNVANNFELQRKVCIPKAQAANKANGYQAAKGNLKFAIAARVKKQEVTRIRIVESLPKLLPPLGLRRKNLIQRIQETFYVSDSHAIVCINLAVERKFLYRITGLKSGVFLFATQKDLQDAVQKGCMPVGEQRRRYYPNRKYNNHPNHHTLTEADIPEIFRLRATGLSGAAIARRYGVDRHTIGAVLRRKTWAYVKI
jgi:hypothetical protein